MGNLLCWKGGDSFLPCDMIGERKQREGYQVEGAWQGWQQG